MSARTNLKGARGTHFKDRNPFWASIPSKGWDDNRDDLRAVLNEIRTHGSIGHSCIGNESSWRPHDSRHRQSTWRRDVEAGREWEAEREREREQWEAERERELEQRQAAREQWQAEQARLREAVDAEKKLRKIEEQCAISPSREEPGEPIPIDLLPNMLDQPLAIGKARVWHDYVMIREEGLSDWVADEYRASFRRVWTGHVHGINLIILRRPQEQTDGKRVA